MNKALELSDISVMLDGRPILKNISLSAGSGEFIGLIGPNGAGKSTLLRAAAGLAPLDQGERSIGGDLTDALTPVERARRLAYLPQARPVFWSMPVRDIVALGRFAYGGATASNPADDTAVAKALSATGAEHLAERPVATLSGGELARIHLARTLAAETPLVLADEPVAALDPAHQLSVMQLLRATADTGQTVIAALHELSLATQYCTRLIILNKGRIAADGAPSEVLTSKLLRNVFKVAVKYQTDGDHVNLAIRPLAD